MNSEVGVSESFVGQSIGRKEDWLLVRGEGSYVADLDVQGTLAVAFVRSPIARGRIVSIDTAAAMVIPGVVGVFTADDIRGKVAPFRLAQEPIPPKLAAWPGAIVETQPCNIDVLADGNVRYVGQPIVVVVASTRYVAEDAAEAIEVVFDEEDPVLDPEASMRPGSALVDEHTPGNVGARLHIETGDVEHAFATAANTLELRLNIGRITASPMETRGVLAMRSQFENDLTVWSSTQVPYIVRSAIARQLGLPQDRVRVVAPNVGGGFGGKVHVYPEEILIPYLALVIGRPVRWVEDRLEHLMSMGHGRDQIHNVKVAFDNDGVVQGLKDEYLLDGGVGLPYPLSSAYNTISHLRGLYRIPNMTADCYCVLTNKVYNVPYRGSGRPEASFVIDRIFYEVAKRVNLDMLEVMRRNLISVEEMPYSAKIPYRDGEEIIYDGCDMAAVLDLAIGELRKAGVDLESIGSSDGPIRRGVGYGTYTEGSGVGPFESGGVMLNPSGTVVVYSGCAPHGQGLDTAISQIVADEIGVSPKEIIFRAGDTSLLPYGVGTFASRSMVTAGSAALVAAQRLKVRMKEIAGDLLEIDPADLEVSNGRVFAKGTPSAAVSFQQIYAAGVPGPHSRLGGNSEPGTSETYYFVPPTVTWGYGVVAAVVAVDIETGIVKVEKLVMTHDCGRVVNPLIVEGQVEGGLVQGLGAALYEGIVYDERGIPLTSSFMDYLLPTSGEVPEILQNHIAIASTRNPVGVKGIGESGTISPPSAIANAIANALGISLKRPEFLNELPISPEAVLLASREA